MQAQAIHAIHGSEADILITASTAGGKTEAAFLPLISALLDRPGEGSGFALLYVAPLKALITDQAGRLDVMCERTDLSIFPWHGDVAQSVKARARRDRGGILLITPESLEAIFVRRGLEVRRLFGAVRAIVIDELHSFLGTERGIHLLSLLARIEGAGKRRIRRVGLSATIGNTDLARSYLRPDAPGDVELIDGGGGQAELKLQLRGYRSGDDEPDAAHHAVADHLFSHLRGRNNLVFAGSRHAVETYADALRELCERRAVPQEFYAHHANLARHDRDLVERRLKDGRRPTTAVCTSTLELGLDIGDIMEVAQIGPPYNVASVRQRLGRSGRRAGQASILRQYVIESKLDSASGFSDRLRLGLMRTIAIIDLLVEGWCEPPRGAALHLSTLTHQILAVIAERGGASASHLYHALCKVGPFRQISKEMFVELLRQLGAADLLEQADGTLLLLGKRGEKMVEHYSFYAVFQTPEEFRLIADHRELGTLPVTNILAPGMMIVFSGQRWLVEEIHDREKTIIVKPARAGVAPKFGGAPGEIHDRVIRRMFDLFEGQSRPIYIDDTAAELLDEARFHYDRMGFRHHPIHILGEAGAIIATRAGTVGTTTLALALKGLAFTVEQHDGFLEVQATGDAPPLADALARLAAAPNKPMLVGNETLMVEKFHPYLSRQLLIRDAQSSRLDTSALPSLLQALMHEPG